MKMMDVLVENIRSKGVVTPYDFTEEEFWVEIKNAEKGPFISIDELERRMEKWKRELNEKK